MHLYADFAVRYAADRTIAPSFTAPLENAAITVLFGPSGCGKTTTLRAIAGFVRPARGSIRMGQSVWFDTTSGTDLPVRSRRIGMVFQDFALFPHLSVAANIAYGIARTRRTQRTHRVNELLDMCGLAHLADCLPGEISGGEQQRTALARAVAPRPQLLLMDEPLAALDEQTRRRVRERLREVLSSLGTPAIIVTHDLSEAIGIADHLVVMGPSRPTGGEAGSVLQEGRADEILSRPATAAVAASMGIENLLHASVRQVHAGTVLVAICDGALLIEAPFREGSAQIGDDVILGFRATDVVLSHRQSGSDNTQARELPEARITRVSREPTGLKVVLDASTSITALITGFPIDPQWTKVGEQVRVSILPGRAMVFQN